MPKTPRIAFAITAPTMPRMMFMNTPMLLFMNFSASQPASLREATAAWFARNARRLSLEHSLETVLAAYEHEAGMAA